MIVTDLAPQSGQSVTSVTTTATYDDLGRVLTLNDPDRGNHTYSYDADDQLLTDVSGSRTLGYSYDLLGRLGCLQDTAPTLDPHGACTSGAHPFVQNTYDSDPSGVTWSGTNYAVGQLTQSIASTYYPAPDSATGTVTENYQYDQLGRTITKLLNMAVTGGSNIVFPTFPSYQATFAYNDADQLTTTQTSVGGTTGYTFTQAYDSTTGMQIGLSNTSTASTNLAALSYNNNGLVSTITLKDSSGANLASENLLYDGDLRPASVTTSWANGGSTIYSDAVSYDNVGNVLSRSTTQAAVSGVSGSGGSEVQNFCYNEQNQMVWASNASTASPASGQTCGSATLQSTLGGSYTHSYVYTNLGQLWQGPLNGGGTQEQYLYCSSGHPHQVTALSPTSSNPTCSATGTTDYSASYDAWGNMTSRVTGTTTSSSLSFDAQDNLVRWNGNTATAADGEWYLYDADGNRVMRRSASTTSGGNPATATATITVYAFGLEEHTYAYSGSGSTMTNTGNTYYYTLAGSLIGQLSGISTPSTSFLLTDLLGSVVSTISNTAGSSQLMGNQIYGPYGEKRYSAGTINTAKGFTDQYSDDLTGLDYDNARYYDPVVGRFLSADVIEGNEVGMDPYAYVANNPETDTDPSGLLITHGGGGGAGAIDIGEGGGGGGDGWDQFWAGVAATVGAWFGVHSGSSTPTYHTSSSSSDYHAISISVAPQPRSQADSLTHLGSAVGSSTTYSRSKSQSITHKGGFTSPTDLATKAREVQAKAKDKSPNHAGKAGAATNVKKASTGEDITAHHAGLGKGPVQPVESDDGSIVWNPDTGPEYYGTCGGSEICEAIAQEAAQNGTDHFPTVVDIVEQQRSGLPACPQCQENAKRLARAIGKIVRLFTLDETGDNFNGPPKIYYP